MKKNDALLVVATVFCLALVVAGVVFGMIELLKSDCPIFWKFVAVVFVSLLLDVACNWNDIFEDKKEDCTE